MSAKLKTVFMFLIIVVLFTFISCQKKAPLIKPTEYNLSVEKVNNIWKVVNSGNTDTIVVHEKDRIKWNIDSNTVAYFQFPVEDKKVFDIKAPGSGKMPDGYTIVVSAGDSLSLKIKDNPQKGPIVYAVFCIADSVYAIQDSPPVVVVE